MDLNGSQRAVSRFFMFQIIHFLVNWTGKLRKRAEKTTELGRRSRTLVGVRINARYSACRMMDPPYLPIPRLHYIPVSFYQKLLVDQFIIASMGLPSQLISIFKDSVSKKTNSRNANSLWSYCSEIFIGGCSIALLK